ncbi:hypothetical protein Enr13x_24060 [Stieleria neptunia]|uniref:Glycosyltransferase RgtA/B/C/D-like domain-containing protein n=1 Tax=Stieleria neptunia TaxID=2527979 RepID=A0A518HNY8_9BACT|nr:hypothetical protein [Stieleria neptunia]QDV42558.1 hypothetical protein Enr13x_24060 [Stieleria neptunia]
MNQEWWDAFEFSLLGAVDVTLCFLVARLAVGKSNLPTLALSSLLLLWCNVVIAGTVLGAVGILQAAFLGRLVAIQLIAAYGGAIGLVLLRRSGCEGEVLTTAARREKASVTQATGDRRRWSRYARWQLIFLSVFSAHVLTYGIVQLPFDWDSIAYHLPLIDHWIQSGSIWNQDCAFWYVPGNNELLGLFFSIGFSGDFWVQLHNTIPGLILFASLAALAIELRLSTVACCLVSMTVFAVQPVLRQLVSAENDLSVVALLVAGALFGWRWVYERSYSSLLFLSLSVGLLAGIKYYALGYVTLLTLAPVAWLAVQGRWKAAVQTLAAILVASLILAGFWYIRNWQLAGTPFYPKGILGMPDLWSEMRPHFSSSKLLGCGRAEVIPLLFRAWLVQAGILPLITVSLAWLPLSLLLFKPIQTWQSIAGGEKGGLFPWLACFSSAAFAVYLVTPNVVETEYGTMNMLQLQYHPVRFGLCAFVTSLLALSAIPHPAGRWPIQLRRLLLAICMLLILVQVAWQSCAVFNWTTVPDWLNVNFWWAAGKRRLMLTWVLLLIFSYAGITGVSELVRVKSLRATAATVALAIGLFSQVSPLLAKKWHNRYVGHFGRVLRTDCLAAWEELKQPSDRLGVFEYRYYPFLGSRRENPVVRPLWHSSADELREYITENQLSMLVFPTTPEVAHDRYRESRMWFHKEFAGEMVFYRDRRLVLARRPIKRGD